MRNLTADLESTFTSYPRTQFSNHLHYFLKSYDYCTISVTFAYGGTSGRNTYQLVDYPSISTESTYTVQHP